MLYSCSPHHLVIEAGFAMAKSVARKKCIGTMPEKSRLVAYHAVCWHVQVAPRQRCRNSNMEKELEPLGSCSKCPCRKCVCVHVIQLRSQQQRHFWQTKVKNCRNLSQRVTFVDIQDIRLAVTGGRKEAAHSASSQLCFSFHVWWWWSALTFAWRRCKAIKPWLGYRDGGDSLPWCHTELYLASLCTSCTRTMRVVQIGRQQLAQRCCG